MKKPASLCANLKIICKEQAHTGTNISGSKNLRLVTPLTFACVLTKNGAHGSRWGDPVSAPAACSQCIIKCKFPLKVRNVNLPVLGNVLSYSVLNIS